MLSGVDATSAGRTGESTSWQDVAVEQACGEPPSRSTVKVSVTAVLEEGESTASGRTTRKVVEDSVKSELAGRGVPFTSTAVVQIKFVPER